MAVDWIDRRPAIATAGEDLLKDPGSEIDRAGPPS